MYSKKKDRELFKKIDESLSIPKGFYRFIKKIAKKNNLIIKNKKSYYCTNCRKEISIRSDCKVGEYRTCPSCKQNLLIKSKQLKNYTFKDDVCIFDEYENYYIERIFELRSDFKNDVFDTICFEWGRKIYDKTTLRVRNEIMNENVIGTTSGFWISYRPDDKKKWYESASYYTPLLYIQSYIYYPGTIKKILKKVEKYKYSQLWELVKHVNNLDLIYLLREYNSSIELLTKMKLYNLALNPKSFLNKKSFEERFGVDKNYLPFMIKNNINIGELSVLSKFKIQDIKLVRKISNIRNYEELSERINVITALELTNLNDSNSREYEDYLEMAIFLNLDSKKDLYPKNIEIAHDEILKRYEITKDEMINKKIISRGKKLEKNSYKNNKYIIFPANSIESLKEESMQQHNCVSTYAEKIAKKTCDIYFMRLVNSPNCSLVTVEVKNNKIVQKRTKFNQNTTESQDKFLSVWESEVLNA